MEYWWGVKMRSDSIALKKKSVSTKRSLRKPRFTVASRNQIIIFASIAHIYLYLFCFYSRIRSLSLLSLSLSFAHCFSHSSVNVLFVLPRSVSGYITAASMTMYTMCIQFLSVAPPPLSLSLLPIFFSLFLSSNTVL